ncbi:MAG: hypothetical protein ACRDHM_00180 [Actinomycetota bacterium]
MASSQPSSGIPWLLAVAVMASAAASTLVVASRPVAAGVVAAGAVGASILAGLGARRFGAPRLVFADHAVERVLEALLFGSVAWAAVPGEPWTAGAAVSALIASYLASYLSAKAIGLGFEVHERVPYRSVRPFLAVVGLLFPRILDVALWAAAVISLEVVLRHGLSVARQREPA